ncbi:FAD-dependent oxidoreductase [Actinomycetospora flava]|uniref:FAD-dependent oxidoreductase n=1 Tax=Actinomycetospora flava TaxID=3129232 RepID=A0ABU8M0R1_9PSEU
MTQRTTCAVVGGGPAGIVLGLVLARAGVEVTVLEKHGDFLRDFRGDTVHPSTMTLIDELGLWDRFEALPWKPIDSVRVVVDAGPAQIGDLSRLREPHPFVAMVPQWHLLDMLAAAGEEEPTFTLIRHAEVTDLVRRGGRVTGVRWGSSGIEGHELAADLVVACDGRDSRVRELSGLPQHDFAVPMDVWWFRLPREPEDPAGGLGRLSADGRMIIMIDRGDHYQVAYLIARGTDAESRRGPVQALRDDLDRAMPWLGERVDALESWDDVKLLRVALNRLRRWSAPGLLCIGDAAHAMSPVGGVGINLAVQDAVATARLLAPALGPDPDPAAVDRAARRVQRRRWFPTVATQTAQRIAHRVVVRNVLRGGGLGVGRLPAPVRLLQRVPALQVVPAYLVGVGFLPERAPAWARRGQDASAKNSSAFPSGSVKDSAQP